MRSEAEMLELILNKARNDERIRAVIMNGSRANPDAPRDFFQDFDVVYFVTDVLPFRNNLEWIKDFGELMILQLPEEMVDPPPQNSDSYAYLMQFMDGNRIDLGIAPLEKINEYTDESLTILLMDKDGLIRLLPPASESDYLPEPPTEKAYDDCCNEFWWVCPYVAKGLWRQEIIYAQHMLDQFARPQLMKMLVWHIGVRTGFSCNPGKFGKYFQRYLEPEMWQQLLETYSDADYEHTWDALVAMGQLFRKVANPLAKHFGFTYPLDDDTRVSAHLEHIRHLPRDEQEMY
jgi:aminoglycoside 6-adenylyltransferase